MVKINIKEETIEFEKGDNSLVSALVSGCKGKTKVKAFGKELKVKKPK